MASPYPHYVWAFGHFVVLLSTLWYLKAYITFKSATYLWYYKSAFYGAIISYSIVCYKSLGAPSPSKAWVQRALADENVQYLIMALLWAFSKPLPIALIPYSIFSLFHALSFARTTIIPLLYKTNAPAPQGQARANASPRPDATVPLSRTLGSWIKANYDLAMQIVSQVELLIFARAFFGVFLLQNSVLIPIVYAHFLRSRYYYSAFTRGTIDQLIARINAKANEPNAHPMLKQVWGQLKLYVGRWATATVIQPAPAPAAAAAGPAGTARR